MIGKDTWIIRIGEDFNIKYRFSRIVNGVKEPIDITDYSFNSDLRECRTNTNAIDELQSPNEIEIIDAADGQMGRY